MQHDDRSVLGRLRLGLGLGTGLLAISAGGARPSRRMPDNFASPGHTSRYPRHHRLRPVGDGDAGVSTATLPKVTLAVPNFARPRNVERIVEQVSKYDLVDETLVWDVHVDPSHKPAIDAERAWVINTPQTRPREKWGLMTRFKDCLLANNEWVLMTDDDQLLGEQDIAAMVQAKQQDPDRLICYFGRELGDGHTLDSVRYQVWDPPAPAFVPVCLTKALLTDRRFCLEAVRLAPMMEDIARAGVPYWNGEDIWHSLTSYHLTGKRHLLLPRNESTYEVLPAPDGIGDARPGPFDHRNHRETTAREGIRRLGLNVSDLHLHVH